MTPVPTLPLNKGQEAAAEAFFSFLFTQEKEMGIDGPGGVGKSFLMSHLIDVIMPRYFETCKLLGILPEYDEVVMLAMTNKAAEVLAESTKRHVSTLHSFLNLKVVENFSTGRSQITKTNNWKVHERKIIFIDEISMMDQPTEAYLSQGTHGCKIVYVGDDKQLRPIVGTNPVYERGLTWATLTEPMRTKIPELQALNDQLRATVDSGVFKPIQIIPGIIDHLDDAQMQAKLDEHFNTQTLTSRILGYTNKRVVDYNDYVRQIRGLPPQFEENELLVNNTAIRLKSSMLSVEAEVELVKLGDPYNIMIEDDVALICRDADLVTQSGAIFTDVSLPMDRAHFHALIAHYKRAKNWERYYYLRNNFPDLRQRDAATTYKAQGSTYETTFIDLTDISTCRNPDQAARLLYVAASRPQKRIFLYGQLSEKYGGLIH